MTAAFVLLLDRVHAVGGTLRLVAPGRLQVSAPRMLSADLVAELRARKPELLAYLASDTVLDAVSVAEYLPRYILAEEARRTRERCGTGYPAQRARDERREQLRAARQCVRPTPPMRLTAAPAAHGALA